MTLMIDALMELSHLLTADALIGLATLTMLEVVLGIDNIIFISILAGSLPVNEQPRARRLGLAGAFFSRMALLFSITWIMRLTVLDQGADVRHRLAGA